MPSISLRPLVPKFSKSSPRTAALPVFLLPFLQQSRNASILSSLSDLPGAYNKRIRRGRGASSGKGKTSGRGHKGQKQHGKVPAGFNGGQTPLEKVHGIRGFSNQFSVDMTTINLDKIQSWIDQGRIDPAKTITLKELHTSRCTHGIKDGVKLLNATLLRTPINIVVSRASEAAINAVEAVGGSVQTRYYTQSSIRRVLQGLTHPTQSLMSPPTDVAMNDAATVTKRFPYRLPDATSRKDIEYYRDPKHRGYLSYLVKDGQGPSLFFKPPAELVAGAVGRGKVGKTAVRSENKLW